MVFIKGSYIYDIRKKKKKKKKEIPAMLQLLSLLMHTIFTILISMIKLTGKQTDVTQAEFRDILSVPQL